MGISTRAYYIASAVCAAAAILAFVGEGDRISGTDQVRATRKVQTTSAATKLKRAEEERTRLDNELRDAQELERKRLQDRVESLDAELKQLRTLVLSSKQSESTLRTLSKDIAQIAGSLAGVASVVLAVMGRRRQRLV